MLLDEPTNHLDVAAIKWLEKLLQGFAGAVVVITQTGAFWTISPLIVELDRGVLVSFPGNFSTYQTRKSGNAGDGGGGTAQADRLQAQEEVWIRKGSERARTCSESRIRRLEQLVQGSRRAARTARPGTVQH